MAAALLLGGCIRYESYPVTRTVGGEVVRGVFVAPSQYEDFVRGELAYAAEDWAGAELAYERARSGGDDDVLLCARLADVRDRRGDRVHAEEALARGEALDPHAEVIWQTRGAIAERHGETDAAIAAYERAHDAEPASEEPVLALARLLAASDHADRAATLLADYVAHAPAPLGAARAALALALTRGDVAGLVDAATQLARIAPGHVDEIESAVRALLAQNDAIVAQHLLARLPESAVDRELAVEVAIAAGDRAAAERWLAFPEGEHPRSLTRDARHWLALGEPDRAAELAEVARSDAEAGSEATVVLAEARLAAGHPAEAARLFASVPAGSSAAEEARRGLADALAAAGLPALAEEIR
jgi:predicted Zn-dependent protease